MAHSPVQLEYALQPSWHRSKRARRGIIAGILLLGVVASLKWVGPAWNHGKVLFYQHRCLTHSELPTRIVYDGDQNRPIALVAKDWEQFYSAFSPPGGRFNATVFLGELTRKDGTARLVSIDVRTIPELDLLVHQFDVHVIKPASLWKQAELCSNTSWRVPYPAEVSMDRIYAGQPDNARADHFTVTIEGANGPVIIDGWLQSNDTILLEAR